jgi:hypothetical protein
VFFRRTHDVEAQRGLLRTLEQRAAERCSRPFAPNTKFRIFARGRVTDLMSLPIVAKLALGPLLTDSLALPSYDSL